MKAAEGGSVALCGLLVVGDRASVKNQVHIEPTRLVVSGMPARAASARNALGDGFGSRFKARVDFAGVFLQIADRSRVPPPWPADCR